MALDGRLLFEAIMDPYNLRPVAAEFSGPEASEFSLRTQCWGGRGLDPGLGGVRVDELQRWGLLQEVESLGSLGQRLIHWVRILYAPWAIRHKGPRPMTGSVKVGCFSPLGPGQELSIPSVPLQIQKPTFMPWPW